MEGAVDSAMNNKSSSGSMSQKEAREARRRKILERGSDRLAFITGEIKSIPPTSPSSQSRDFPAPVRTGDTGLKSLSSAEPRSADSPEGLSDLVDMPVISSSNLQPEGLALDTNARKLTSPTLEPSINPSLSTHKNDGITEGMLAGSSVSVAKPGFSLVNLGHSIDSTQVARVMFSLSFALLLVFHWALRECEHPWRDYLNTWITSWPIATVIVTDIAVALAALLLGFVKVASSEKKEEKTAGRGGLAVFRDVRFAQALAVGTQLEWVLDLSLVAMKSWCLATSVLLSSYNGIFGKKSEGYLCLLDICQQIFHAVGQRRLEFLGTNMDKLVLESLFEALRQRFHEEYREVVERRVYT